MSKPPLVAYEQCLGRKLLNNLDHVLGVVCHRPESLVEIVPTTLTLIV